MRTLLVALAMVAVFAIAAAGNSTSAPANADCSTETCCTGSGSCCN